MTIRGRGFRPAVWLCAAVMGLALASTARAATLTVNTTGDPAATGTGSCGLASGTCSLREAVNEANAAVGGGDVISLPASTTPYTLSYGALTSMASATLTGAGASSTAISGGNTTQIMVVDAPATVTLSGVTLEDGHAVAGDGGAVLVNAEAAMLISSAALTDNVADDNGGAIEDEGGVSVNDSSITENTATEGGGIQLDGTATSVASLGVANSTLSGNHVTQTGGAIRVQDNAAPGTSLTISASALINNTSDQGGGALEDSNGTPPAPVSISDSTIADNTSGTTGGGGLYIGNGPDPDQIINDTIVGNSATGAGAGGGDVRLGGGKGTPMFENTIVAAGTAPSGPDCSAAVTSGGHNLDDLNGCGFTAAPSGTDLVDTNPALGPLQSNGGPTQTMALLAGSPAIDAGSNAVCPTADQRGVPRPQGAACDIGAYESAPPVLGAVSTGSVGTTTAAFTASVADPDVQSGGVFFEIGTSTAYDTTTSAEALPGPSSASPYQLVLGGLTPGTVYHFRVVAADPDGVVYGPDQQFTTAGSAPTTTTTTTTTTTPTPTPPANRFTFGRVKVASGGALTVALGAPDGGHFSAKATFSARRTVITHHGKKRIVKHVKTTYTYGTGSAGSAAKGTSELRIGLSGSAARELKKLGSARVTISVTFTPTGGTSHKESTTLTVKRSRRGKYS